MLIDFFVHALIAGMILAFVAAPLGCFVVWRGMAYFGDAVAHSALLGVVLGLGFQVPIIFAVVPIALLIALLLTRLQHGTQFFNRYVVGDIGASQSGTGDSVAVAERPHSGGSNGLSVW